MKTRDEFLPTQKSKINCIILIILITFLYILESVSITAYIDISLLNFIIKPLLWIGVIYRVLTFPRIRFKSRLKLRGFLYFWAFNFGIIFIIISIFAGVIDGLGKSPYSHSPIGILTNILFIGSMLVGRELVRSYLVNSFTDEENYIVFIIIALMMTLTSISFKKYLDIEGYLSLVKFIAQYLAPEFAQNLFAVYLVYLGGPLTSIIYLGIIQGFHWFSPILPDLKWITTALIGVLGPVFFFMIIQNIYIGASKQLKKKDENEESPFSWIITSILSIGIIWFSVGVFPIYPSVIATGSMEPMIKPGDVILVRKIIDMDGVNQLKAGDVIQFKKDNILISHRIMEIVKSDEEGLGIRTKGDNNSIEDTDVVRPEQVKGIIINVIPKVGWPTLLIKNKDDIPLEQVEF